ncbi:MAG TPA: hypothetical protein VFA55_03105, partial [Candidatus Kapabacteria bacterium]|nr:hypothetical protein [Candidatus Kapabacteria bacterium]
RLSVMSMRTIISRSAFLLCAFLCVAQIAAAQEAAQGQMSDKEMKIKCGINVSDFFSYQITFNTTAKRYFPHSDIPSVYTRQLTYFFTELVDSIGNDGIATIEVNVDSIRIDTKAAQVETHFNSQDNKSLAVVDLRNPELVGTTMILNKGFTFRMTLAGDFIDYTGWDMWLAMIDTTVEIDSASKFADKEYMSRDFVRTLVLTSAGFVYDKTYLDLQHWNQAMSRLVFKTPVIDSAACHIEIAPSHKEAVAFFDGKLYPDLREKTIREHGYADSATVDSLTGVTRDTMMLTDRGIVHFRSNGSTMKMYVHAGKVSYSESVDEAIELKLLAYERR